MFGFNLQAKNYVLTKMPFAIGIGDRFCSSDECAEPVAYAHIAYKLT